MPKKKQPIISEPIQLTPGENLPVLENPSDTVMPDTANGFENESEDLYRRCQDLASLNQVGQNLNKLSEKSAIVTLLADTIQNMLDTGRLFIGIYEETSRSLIPAVYTQNNIASDFSKSSEERAAAEEGLRIRITTGTGEAGNLLTVPLLAGDKLMGVAVIRKRDLRTGFDNAEVDAVVTVCSQAAIALENARLFQEMQAALSELATRERYQNLIARAVAELNNHGTANLQEVLHYVCQAADADQAVFLEEDIPPGNFRIVATYRQPGSDISTGSNLTAVIDERVLREIKIKGWYQQNLEPGPARETINSNPEYPCELLLGVQKRNGILNLLRIDRKLSDRNWDDDNIRAFQLLSSSLANTLDRESLLRELEISLSDSESLYTASQKLARGKDLPTMLSAILEIQAQKIIEQADLILFNENGESSFYRYSLAATWSVEDGARFATAGTHYPFATYNSYFEVQHPFFSDDIHNDPSLTEDARQLFGMQTDYVSVGIIPLFSGEGQIGVLFLRSSRPNVFTDHEKHAFPLLASQMAVAIDNLHLLSQTRSVVTEKDTLYQASAGLALAQSFNEILEVLREHTFLGRDARQLDINLFDRIWTSDETPGWIDQRAVWTNDNEAIQTGRTPIGEIPNAHRLLHQDSPSLIDETQPAVASQLSTVRQYLIQQKAVRLVYLPMVVAGRWIGFIRAAQTALNPVNDADVRSAMSLAGQAALAAQNLDSLEITRRSAADATILFQASQQLSLAGSEKEIFEITLQVIRQALPVQSVSIHQAVSDQGKPSMRQVANRVEAGIPVQRDGSLFPARLFPFYDFSMAGQSTISADTQTDDRLTDTARRYFQLAQTYSVAVIPLPVRGQTFGVILAARNRKISFSGGEVAFLESIAAQAGIALENYRLLLETRSAAREAHEKSLELSLINRVVSSVSSAPDLKSGLLSVIDELISAFSLGSGGIALLNEDRTSLEVVAERSREGQSTGNTIIPVEGNLSAQRVLETRKPLVITDAQHNPLASAIHSMMVRRNIQTIILLPLIVKNEVIGTVGMDIQESDRSLSADEISLAETIVYQAAVAIQNSRLLNQTQSALAETELLFRISRAVAAAESTEELLDLIFEQALPVSANQVIFLFTHPILESEDREVEIAGRRARGSTFTPDGSRFPESDLPVLSQVGMGPLMITDYKTSDLDTRSIETLIRLEFISGCILALRTSGEIIGYILISATQVVNFSASEIRNLQITADGIAVALEKQRLLIQAQRRAVELQTAALVARETSGTLDLDVLLKRMVNLLCERFGFYHASVFLVDDEREFAVVRESTGLAGEEMKARGHKLAVGSRSIMGSVTSTGEPLVVNDVSRSSTHRKNPLLPNTRSELGIPLKIGDRVIGALDVQSTQVNAFHPDDVAVLQILADQIAVAIENAKAYTLSIQAVDEMREADKMKSKFLANMSHELRTPLNSIIGFSRVILKGIDGPVTDIQQQDLTAIYNSGQHLLRLINDILDLSKIEAGKMDLSFNDINLTELVNSVMSTATGLIKDKQIKIVRNIPADLPPVRGDSVRLRQVLINLISNAAKFTDHGTITIDAGQQTGSNKQTEVIVRVTDTGLGISSEDQRKLFQPFSQVDDSPTRKTGGTGLGLSISKSLIDMHGGRIGLEKSRPGDGSTFYFTLPCATVTASQSASGEATKTILAIDPDLRVIRQYQSFLEPRGYQIIPLADSSVAGYHAQRLNPMAVILDVTPRDHSGWKAIKQLRNDPETAGIPMILCSMVQEEGIGFCLGITEFLNKPLRPDTLLSALARLGLNQKFREMLIVDDNIEDLKAIQQAFEDQPNTFLTFAKDAWQARALLTKRKPSAVIMDLIRPDLYRLDLIKELRSNLEYGNMPLIFLIGLDRLQENIDQLDQFNQELLSKLFTKPEGIMDSLERILSFLQLPGKS